mmetsp:Transcript_42599/g.89400  ORF Transcript_42599/g.89400 Transcript_42599/m.89400 type:complete len:83 (+) Transcript_42599:123-371(+)
MALSLIFSSVQQELMTKSNALSPTLKRNLLLPLLLLRQPTFAFGYRSDWLYCPLCHQGSNEEDRDPTRGRVPLRTRKFRSYR